MRGFNCLILFFLCCVLFPCEGKIQRPPDGTRLIVLPGSTVKIKWSFDDKNDAVLNRIWGFRPSNGSIVVVLGLISLDSEPVKRSRSLNFEIEKPATLVLINVNESYNGIYRFRLVRTDDTITSQVTVLIAKKPTITINCSSTVTVDKGDDVVCTCRGEGGNPPADASWHCKGRQIGKTEKEKQTLILRNVNGTYNGTYTCKAQSHNLTAEKSIEVKVMPDIKPAITSFTSNPPKSVVGQRVTITCVASGRPEPRYTIIYNGTRIVSTDNTYNIPKVGWNDTGTYKCNATNTLGNDSKSLTLIVGQSPTTFPTSKTRNRTVGTHTSNHKKKGLGAGAIVGIIISVLVLVVIIIGVIYWFKFKSKKKDREEEENAESLMNPRHADANVYDTPTPGGDDGGASASTSKVPHEYATLEPPMTYASLDKVAMQPSGSKKQEDREERTQYASIDHGKVGKVSEN